MTIHPKYSYPAGFAEQDDGSFLVTFRDLPEALTDGDNYVDAFIEATDCLEEAIAGRLAMGEDIPEPSTLESGELAVPLSAAMSAKAVLRSAMAAHGVSNSQLARGLGCDEKEVRRLLDPRHASKLHRLEQALLWLGYSLSVKVTPVPWRRLLVLAEEFETVVDRDSSGVEDKSLEPDEALALIHQAIAVTDEMLPYFQGEATADRIAEFRHQMSIGASRMRGTIAQGKTPRRLPELPPVADVIDFDQARKRA